MIVSQKHHTWQVRMTDKMSSWLSEMMDFHMENARFGSSLLFLSLQPLRKRSYDIRKVLLYKSKNVSGLSVFFSRTILKWSTHDFIISFYKHCTLAKIELAKWLKANETHSARNEEYEMDLNLSEQRSMSFLLEQKGS